MLQTAGYTVCSKREPFNRPRLISLLSLSLRGCLVKTRTRLPIVSTAQGWVYPSFFSSPYGRIGWHPTASSPFWLVPTTTWLVSIATSSPSDYDHGPSRPASGRMVLHYLLPLFRVCGQNRWRLWPPQDFDHAEPGTPRAECAEFSKWSCYICFLFFFCSDDRAMGFPDSSCLFFDLIPFVCLLS